VENHKKIFFAVLNWGLGHASRSIPLIQFFLDKGVDVVIGSDGQAFQLLKTEFPQLTFIKLPAYGIKYVSDNIMVNVGLNAIRANKAIKREHQVVSDIISKLEPDAIISDNRYGCFDYNIPSILITHQLWLITGYKISDLFVNLLYKRYLRNFNGFWVPDRKGKNNLSGISSHKFVPQQTDYLGLVSRFKYKQKSTSYDIIVVLSGPEPQRTKLEECILVQARKMPLKFLIVQGLTQRSDHFFIQDNIEVYSFLSSGVLVDKILESKLVISRSGYSTILDMISLGKKAIMIPTPGQTEQEYLAKHLEANPQFLFFPQKGFDLQKSVNMANKKIQDVHPPNSGQFFDILEKFVEGI